MTTTRLSIIILFFLAICASSGAFAQKISNVNPNIAFVDGGVFYIHEVLEGQHIEDIAFAYYADLGEVLNKNPKARIGIKVGDKLNIPYSDESMEPMAAISAGKIPAPRVQPKPVTAPPKATPLMISDPKEIVVKEPEPVEEIKEVITEESFVVLDKPIDEAIALFDELTIEEEPEVEKIMEESELEISPKPNPKKEEKTKKPKRIKSEEVEVEEEKVDSVEQFVQEKIEDEPKVEIAPLPENVVSNEKVEEVEEAESAENVEKQEISVLSNSIRESLNTLKQMKEALTGETVEESETALNQSVIDDAEPAIDFLKKKLYERYEADSSINEFYLKEFFLAKVDPSGVIVSLKDERTITNSNTFDLDIQDVAGLALSSYTKLDQSPGNEAVGLNADIELYRYKLNIKKNKIRVYNQKFYVERLPRDDPHYDLIRERADNDGKVGKCEVVIFEGALFTARYKKVEYNIFAELDALIDHQKVSEIVKMRFKKP